MKCPRCQHENREARRFCAKCGAALAPSCPHCDFTNEPNDEFCGGCGARLGAPNPAQDTFTSPDTYTPKHLAEKILTSKSALEGERKQVTVLFADLKGSMELLADRDPEEARKILDPVLERMMEAVHRYEGTVNQVMGDGIMALFGAPVAHEDHAVRACYAALRMQESVKRYAEGVRRQQGISVCIRVGLNSGEVVVRAIGSDLHMDYTAVGQTTHLAARMEQFADPGTILLPSATLALAEDFIQVRPQGPTPVKGMTEPVEVYELVGATPVRSRFHAHAARGLTTFVGRTGEMAQLTQALDLVRSGRGQVVAVVGEPGVGKSRLFWEFGHSHRTAGCLVLESASVPYGKATTYLPVIELLRGYFQIEPRDDTRKIREKVTGKLLSLDRSLELAVPPLLSLLDVPPEDAEWTRLNPAQRRQRTLDALKRLFLRESQLQPLVVLFEDLHWIDDETQAVLDGLVASLPTARVLLLVNYRPEYRHSWGSKTYYRQLRVDTLPAASAENFLHALLGKDPSLAPLERLLIERTEGNPLFLEESVRTLVETRALVGEPGAYRLMRSPDSFEIPATAQSIIAARVDRLEPDDKRLLQAASVLGKDVPLVLLEAINDIREDELRQRLGRLQAAEFLYEARLFPEVEYTFKHALTHEVTYASLLRERRRALHGRIVEAIESLAADRLDEHAGRLAHHAFEGQRWPKAFAYARAAGERALARFANRDAVALFDQALAALACLEPTREKQEQAVDLRFALQGALIPLGENVRTLERLREARDLAQELGDASRRGHALAGESNTLCLVGDFQAALDAGREAQKAVAELGDVALKTAAGIYPGRALVALGRFAEASAALLPIVTHLSGDPARGFWILGVPALPAVFARSFFVDALIEQGCFDQAACHAADALAIAEAVDDPTSLSPGTADTLVWGWSIMGFVPLARGLPRDAIGPFERVLDLCRAHDLPTYVLTAASALAEAQALDGNARNAVRLLSPLLEEARRRRKVYSLARNLVRLGEASLLAGVAVDARAAAEEALDLARRRGMRGVEAYALRLKAETTERSRPFAPGEADRTYAEALEIADSLGMRPLVAHCHLGLGKLYRRTGKSERAREHLTTATTMYREMEMRYWLEQAEAELRALA